jgi:hypothetical protein
LTGVEYPFEDHNAQTKDDHLHGQAIGIGGVAWSAATGDIVVNQLTFQPSATF